MGRPSHILVVGASLAGLRTAEALRAEGFDGRLTILGDEPHAPYDRPPLSKGTVTGHSPVALRVRPGLEAEWLLGERAVAVDVERRAVTTEAGRSVGYDGLVIATGSVPRRLPTVTPDRAGVHELRTFDDALALSVALRSRPTVAIVGAGFIGVELASMARALGLDVTLVSLEDPLAAAGVLVSELTAETLREHGVRLHLGHSVLRIERDGSAVTALELSDGTRVACGVVVSAVGARPAVDWLAGSGLTLDDGLRCDPWCAAVGAEGVVAAGDVVRRPDPADPGSTLRVEHWSNAVEQAGTAARTLLGGERAAGARRTVPSFWSDHFGHRLQVLGRPGLADRYALVEGGYGERRFAATGMRGEELVAAVAYDLPRALGPLRARLAAAVDRPAALA